jgi:glutamate-1-semialdehyde 2,1-aminomutase
MKSHSQRKSELLLQQARQVLAGGVGSGARRDIPIFTERGDGSRIYDVDGNEYIDCLLALGPLILGHRPEPVIRAVTNQITNNGSMYGTAHRLEQEVCRKIIAAVPSAELVSFANSGSEAVLLALRLARACTGKDKIVRFEGHYHGWTDVIAISSAPPLAAAGRPNAPWRVRDSNGTPELYSELVIPQPWNAPEILEETIRRCRYEIAAVITEPIMGNCGCILPKPGYLEFVREITADNDILLIFDEVITGFRVALGGAQAFYGVTPDITTMAKALGGGFPIAAVAGRKEIMDLISNGEVGQYGTYCTSPLVMSAANAVLDELAKPASYEHLFELGERLASGLEEVVSRAGFPVVQQGVGPFFQIFFSDGQIDDYRQAVTMARAEPYRAFCRAMRKRGVLFHPWPLENWFVSTAHTLDDVDEVLNRAEDAIREVV